MEAWNNVLGHCVGFQHWGSSSVLAGHSLHAQFDVFGKAPLYLSMCLLSAFVGTIAVTYNLWRYLRETRRIYEKG